jgi:hypothetical protein
MAKKLDTKIFAIRDLEPADRVPSHFCAIHHSFAVFLGRQGWMSQGWAVEGCGSLRGSRIIFRCCERQQLRSLLPKSVPSLRDLFLSVGLTPDLRPGLSYAVPFGTGVGWYGPHLCPMKLVPCGDAAVFLQPLQLFADFDFSVPGILCQRVAFAGEDQEFVGNA